MFCIHCGKEVPDNSKFCVYCGENVLIEKYEDMKDSVKIEKNNNKDISNIKNKINIEAGVLKTKIGEQIKDVNFESLKKNTSNIVEKYKSLKIFEGKSKKFQIAVATAIMSTLIWIIGIILEFKTSLPAAVPNTFAIIAVALVVITYLCAGLVNAIKMALNAGKKAAKWGWLILPFPYDICTFIVALIGVTIYAAIALVFLPIIPILKSLKEN